MQYAFMSFSTPELSLNEMLETAVLYGYDGIEPRLDAGHKHGVEVATSAAERDAIRNAVKASGIALACLATSLKYADPASKQAVLEESHARIDLAGDLGVGTLRVFGGAIPEGFGRQAAIALLVDSFKTLADHAAERGVLLCMETHDHWCNPVHVASVMAAVDHPAVAVNWDIMHPVRMKFATIEESFETLKPWIRHLHVHDGVPGEKLQLTPIGQGVIDHRRALELLKTIDYTGFISGEWIRWSDPYDVHLPRELATLKAYENE